MITPQTLKGFRDFLPAEVQKRQYVINIIKHVCELYGFQPLETPTLEYEEILTGKYGEEGEKLMYRFTDNGKRNVAMRYDQTVPLARVIAQFQNQLSMPFKRFQVQNVWRAENTQKGRFREFIQYDLDTVGTSSPQADAEILAVAYTSLKNLGFKDFTIYINNRDILSRLTRQAEIPEEKQILALQILDKRDKVNSFNDLLTEWTAKGLKKESLETLESLLNDMQMKWNGDKTTQTELDEIYNIATGLGIPEDTIQLKPSIVRGLNYYTGMIFEISIDEYTAGSVCGGGRYDKLIGMFAQKDIPAVGCAFGFDRIIEAMNDLDLFPPIVTQSKTKVLVSIYTKELQKKSMQICSQLRMQNIPAELYLGEIKEKNPLEKQLKYALSKGIPYLLIITPEESKKEIVTLKNLQTREQKHIREEKIAENITGDTTV